jgi:hypothetical protein
MLARLPSAVVWLSRLVLGCVLLSSSVAKLRQPYDFLANVYQYELVSPKIGLLVAMALPWLELLLAICLFGGVFLGGSFLLTVSLAAIFIAAQLSVLHRGMFISCGCFGGPAETVIAYGTLVRTALFGVMALGGYFSWIMRSSALYPAHDRATEDKSFVQPLHTDERPLAQRPSVRTPEDLVPNSPSVR